MVHKDPGIVNRLTGSLVSWYPGTIDIQGQSQWPSRLAVKAPYEIVVPLFGAYEERCWGGEDWKPEFFYPTPACDKQGEVFTQAHGNSRSIWVNTALDLESGHIQYVYVVPDSIAALIDIHVKRADSANTSVKVVYQQTALKPELNAHVSEAARRHREMGPHWARALEECLKPKKS